MYPQNYEEIETRKPGRPIDGYQAKEMSLKIRMEPYLMQRLNYYCKMLGISKAEAIRRAIMIFIETGENYERERERTK